MAYEYKKLSEVEAIDVADSSVNLIVETEDEIKKLNIGDLPIGQEQSDWDEEDATKASFIKNKPDLSQVGGSAKVTYLLSSSLSITTKSLTFEDGSSITIPRLLEALQTGLVIIKCPPYPSYGYQADYCFSIISYVYIPEQDYTTTSGNSEHRNAALTACYYHSENSQISRLYF